MGTAMIARVLEAEGLRVGVIAQPRDASDHGDSLGEPGLFLGG